jgi:uncharacterized protein (UPF0548 family)
MISVRRPSPPRVEEYRAERIGQTPTCVPTGEPPAGFHHDSFTRVVGSGAESFQRARLGLGEWVAHRGAGVEVFPTSAPLESGSTVAIVTRQLGLWVLAACRIESVIEEPNRFGFVYATLPDHPECGYESFVVEVGDDDVVFRIDVVSRTAVPLIGLGAPVTRLLQHRATDGYLTALATWVQDRSRSV